MFRHHFFINAARELATEHSMRWQQLSLKYYMAFFCHVLPGCLSLNKASWNIALDGRPHLHTSALLSQGCIHPRTAFLGSYDQISPLHSLAWTSMTVFYPSSNQLISSDWAPGSIYTQIHTTGPITLAIIIIIIIITLPNYYSILSSHH